MSRIVGRQREPYAGHNNQGSFDIEPSAPVWSNGSETSHHAPYHEQTHHSGPVTVPPEATASPYHAGSGYVHPYPHPSSPTRERMSPIYIEPPKERSKMRTSWIVPTVVVTACTAMFIVTMGVNNCPKHLKGTVKKCVLKSLGRFSFQPLQENPLFGPSSSTLLKVGALPSKRVTKEGQAWRIFSCMWLHAGFFHLLCNMIGVVYVGVRLEKEFGAFKIAVVYLISGIGGSLLSALFLGSQISVGASGALFGLIGATLSELLVNWSLYAQRAAALMTLLFLIAINLVFGLMPYVDNFAHLGGLATGFLMGATLLVKPHWGWVRRHHMAVQPEGFQRPARNSPYQHIFRIVATAVLVGGFVGAIVALASNVDGNKECSWCHYLSCVPTSLWSCDPATSASGSGGPVVCTVTTYSAGNGTLTCPDNHNVTFGNLTSYSDPQLRSLCTKTCQ
eukprot:jgi/Mesen1/10834/ME000093S10355